MKLKLILVLIMALSNLYSANNYDEILNNLFGKKKITIVITDSGLGGLSVCAGLEEVFSKTKSFEEVNLVFFNAIPADRTPYNSLPSPEVKAQYFDRALSAMDSIYSPVLILIACNTLSVVYPLTEFNKEGKTPVIGIVEMGVESIYEKMEKENNSSVILFGTQTTIGSEAHKNMLKEKGIADGRIVSEACPNLESEIQRDPDGDLTAGMIELFVEDAATAIPDTDDKVYAALCCSHYGYSKNLFENTLKNKFDTGVEIINPNDSMTSLFEKEEYKNRYPETNLDVIVHSAVTISDEEKNGIGGLIADFAPLTEKALHNYKFKP